MTGLLGKYRRDVYIVGIVLGLLMCYKGYQSYTRFEWVNVPVGPSHVVAIPAFRK